MRIIRIGHTGKLVEIEPWTSYIEEYIMPLCWEPETYNYTYNHYDEKERFLIPVKKLPKDKTPLSEDDIRKIEGLLC